MIKVYCFVSCVCEIIKCIFGVDYCLFYFGVWDVDFLINDQYELFYYLFYIWYEDFCQWY